MADAKKSAGEVAIETSVKPGASNGAVLKALWSIRGALWVRMGSRMVPVVKAALVNELKVKDESAPSGLLLVAMSNGEYEVREKVVATRKAPEPVVQE